MASIIDEFMRSLGPEVSDQLSTNLGIERNTVEQMLPQLGPMILGGLKRQKDNFGGQERVDHILNKYGSADVLDNIGDFFSAQVQNQNADPRLGGLLGDSGLQATNALSKQFNIDGSTAMKIIPMLAPIILGFLTKTRDRGGAGSAGIASILDRDGDGSILDDVAEMFLQGSTGRSRSGGGGLLGGLLGSLLGRRR
ncbi:MAG: DUF937 domain-containing protein [Desulfobacterales bacterium]|jgi:hypothetical protein